MLLTEPTIAATHQFQLSAKSTVPKGLLPRLFCFICTSKLQNISFVCRLHDIKNEFKQCVDFFTFWTFWKRAFEQHSFKSLSE